MKSVRAALAAAICALVTVLCSAPAQTSIIVDESPDALGGTLYQCCWADFSKDQNFLVQITLGAPTTLTGMSIYSDPREGFKNALDSLMTIKWATDSGGTPGAINSLVTTVDTIDTSDAGTTGLDRVHSSFSFSLSA